MNRLHFLTAALAAISTHLAAQQPATLLFATHGNEQTRSGSNGTVLANLQPRAIGVFTPDANLAASAEKFGPGIGFQTLAGDDDGNASVYNPDLTGPIDALAVLPYEWDRQLGARPRQSPVTLLECYISPSHDVGTNVSGVPGLRKGDCGRFVRTAAGNGQVSWFVTAEQLIQAFGMFDPANLQPLAPDDIDLDAITVTMDRHVFVSFDGDHWMRLQQGGALVNMLVPDGAVLCIPGPVWTPNARGEVGAVLPNRGVVVITEPQANTLALNAALTDVAGACVPAMVDTEGLAVDPAGGTFTSMWGNQQLTWPHLLLNGELMTGAGVITTRGGGQIAQVNGAPLARACGAGPTTGIQMGLAPSGSVARLGALETLAKEPFWFVLGSPTPNGLGGPVEVHVGTNLPAGMALVGFGLGALPVSPSIDFSPWSPNNACFPELYPTILPNPFFPVPLGAGVGGARFGALTFAGSPMVAPGILFQAVTVTGATLHLSTPATLN